MSELFIFNCAIMASRDGADGTAAGCGVGGRGVGIQVPVGARFFSASRHPDRFRGPLSLISNGFQGYFSRGVKLTTHLQLVPRSRIHIHSPIRLHGVDNFTFFH
jgi:hypothetical protein